MKREMKEKAREREGEEGEGSAGESCVRPRGVNVLSTLIPRLTMMFLCCYVNAAAPGRPAPHSAFSARTGSPANGSPGLPAIQHPIAPL